MKTVMEAFKILRTAFPRFCREDDGPTTAEYAVMLALIAAFCVSSVQMLGCRAAFTFIKAERALR